MLAPKILPDGYAAWNRKVGAPAGLQRLQLASFLTGKSARRLGQRFPRLGGPFAIQTNNQIRRYEYPWAFHAVPVVPGSLVVDLGGSLCGFQFILARAGAQVINVDPGEGAHGRGWSVRADSVARLNRAFGAQVRLIESTLAEAGLPDEGVDSVYSISTIEHIPERELAGTMEQVRRILKPGGHAVLTIDLFLDLAPFTSRQSNEWGINVNVRSLIEASGLDMVQGDRSQLYGFVEFDKDRIQSHLNSFLLGSYYPAMAQCVVLRKPK